jgi:hypothetical protein
MERPEAQKTRHELVEYTPKSPHIAERCARCEHFIRPNRCETVKSPIAAAGWCKRFERK